MTLIITKPLVIVYAGVELVVEQGRIVETNTGRFNGRIGAGI